MADLVSLHKMLDITQKNIEDTAVIIIQTQEALSMLEEFKSFLESRIRFEE